MAPLPIHKKETIMKQKNLLHHLFEAFKNYRQERETENGTGNLGNGRLHRLARWLMPNGGTLLIALLLILTQNVWAGPAQTPASAVGPSATTVNYQGRLADSSGNPKTDTFGMSFSIWDAAAGGNIVWGPENHIAVPVTDGLFNVALGSQTTNGIPTTVWNGDRYLEITVAGETLAPREIIRAVPIAGMALTVPEGSIQSRNLNLDSGQICLSNDKVVTMPGQLTPISIPELTMELELERPSKVLFWMNGLSMFNQDSEEAHYIELLVDGVAQISSHTHFDNQWDDIRGQRIVSLNSGTHQISIQARSKQPGNLTLHGRDSWITCAYYLVLGE